MHDIGGGQGEKGYAQPPPLVGVVVAETGEVSRLLPIWLIEALPAWLVIALAFDAAAALAVAIRYREVRKFLAGAFFVSSGILWFLWFTGTSVPIILPYAGRVSLETPDISGQRAIVHFVLFLLCLYFGFFRSRGRSK